MLSKERIYEILNNAGVLLEGHFLLTSGKHSDKYLQCAKIFKNAKYSEELCKDLALKFKEDNINFVIGPAIGAIQMAYEISRQIGVENIFAERENGIMTLRRGFEIVPGNRYLIVEDVITTGGSVKEVKEIVESNGGIVAGIGCIVDRTYGKLDLKVKFESVISIDVTSYESDKCPICEKGDMPLIKPGSRIIKN